MTTDNASGAGMETVAWLCDPRPEGWNDHAPEWQMATTDKYVSEHPDNPYWKPTEELVRRTDATRLLAESQAELKGAYELLHQTEDRLMASQAHNAKLEAQVERLRALVLTCATRLEFADAMLTAAAGEPTEDNFNYSRDCAEAAKRCGQAAEEARDALKP